MTGWIHEPMNCACLRGRYVSSGNRVMGRAERFSEEVSRTPRAHEILQCRTLEQKHVYLQHFFLFRKTKLQQIGGADESLGDFPGIDDFDMIWVLLEHGANSRDRCNQTITTEIITATV